MARTISCRTTGNGILSPTRAHTITTLCGAGGSKRQQGTFCAKACVDPRDPRAGRHQQLRRGTEQTAHWPKVIRLKAAGSGDKDMVANRQTRLRPRFDHFARSLIAGDQRIAHAGTGWHRAGPEQFFGPGRNAGMMDANHDIGNTGLSQNHLPEGEVFGS